MVTPNPRSLGDSFPDSRSLNKGDRAGAHHEDAGEARSSGADEASKQRESEQEFHNPMTEEDTASGGPPAP